MRELPIGKGHEDGRVHGQLSSPWRSGRRFANFQRQRGPAGPPIGGFCANAPFRREDRPPAKQHDMHTSLRQQSQHPIVLLLLYESGVREASLTARLPAPQDLPHHPPHWRRRWTRSRSPPIRRPRAGYPGRAGRQAARRTARQTATRAAATRAVL